MKNYLDFERDIKVLEEEIEKLRDPFDKEGLSEVNTQKISEIEKQIDEKLITTYSNLNEWQKTQIARHEDRPKAKFFIENLFTDFINLSGDRNYAEDESVLAGFAKLEGLSVLVIGQEKGEDLESRLKRNFGSMKPEGYRKCIRLMKMADKFNIPVITFIDTPGAFPSVGSERRGQAQAIASSIECQMSLKVPVIAVIIGEGGSGGAIALASANKVLMFENAIYSVISPEGCAAILWKDPTKTLESAKAMKLTAQDLLKKQVIDEIIVEPIGGAHRNREDIIKNCKKALLKYLEEFNHYSREQIFEQRKNKFLNIGTQKSFNIFLKEGNWIDKKKFLQKFNDILLKYKKKIILAFFIMIFAALFFIIK